VLDPLSSALAPVTGQLADAIPLDTITSQLPALGVDGSGGLVQDLVGQDVLTGVVGSDGVVGTLLGGGNSGVIGGVVPPGTLPSLPTGSDPTQAVTGLASTVTDALGGAGSGGLPSTGTPLDLTTGAVSGVLGSVTNPATLTSATNSASGLGGMVSSGGLPSASGVVSSVVGTVTSIANP
jgi:hypothetical protein